MKKKQTKSKANLAPKNQQTKGKFSISVFLDPTSLFLWISISWDMFFGKKS